MLNRRGGFTPNSGHGLASRKLTLCAKTKQPLVDLSTFSARGQRSRSGL